MTVLAGHSAGGLFALDVAATHPGSFLGIIAMDPAIWFNDAAPARLYADAIARSSSTGARIFTGHGGLEADIDAATTQFAENLDAIKPPTLGFAHRRYPADSHALVPLSAFPDGLRFVFAPVSTGHLPIATLDERADATAVIAALSESEAQYALAARSLQLQESLPEATVHRAARFALTRLKDTDLALWVLERNVALHPDSAQAVARLADGYIATGDLASAVKQLRKAISLAPTSPQTYLPTHEPSCAIWNVVDRPSSIVHRLEGASIVHRLDRHRLDDGRYDDGRSTMDDPLPFTRPRILATA